MLTLLHEQQAECSQLHLLSTFPRFAAKHKWFQIAGTNITWPSHGFRYQVVSLLSVYNPSSYTVMLTHVNTRVPSLSARSLAPGQNTASTELE